MNLHKWLMVYLAQLSVSWLIVAKAIFNLFAAPKNRGNHKRILHNIQENFPKHFSPARSFVEGFSCQPIGAQFPPT